MTGLDILDDVDDFWNWLHSKTLADLLAQQGSPIELDLERILTAGDSAGGLLSVYLTLSHPDEIRAGTAAYPSLSWDNPPMLPSTRSSLLADVPESVIDEYLEKLEPGYVESSDLALQRVRLSAAITGHQRGYGFFIRDSETSPHRDRLYQLSRLEKPDAKLPRGGLVIIHGNEDDAVLPKASVRFVNKARDVLKGKQGADKVVLTVRPGGHGFDVNARLNEQWLSDALKTAIDTWLE